MWNKVIIESGTLFRMYFWNIISWACLFSQINNAISWPFLQALFSVPQNSSRARFKRSELCVKNHEIILLNWTHKEYHALLTWVRLQLPYCICFSAMKRQFQDQNLSNHLTKPHSENWQALQNIFWRANIVFIYCSIHHVA